MGLSGENCHLGARDLVLVAGPFQQSLQDMVYRFIVKRNDRRLNFPQARGHVGKPDARLFGQLLEAVIEGFSFKGDGNVCLWGLLCPQYGGGQQ
jgi:hypothetical protein